ncbi:MAG TPA: hypothetical protein VNB64_09745, partial [Solirubrobacteraceae bacterium]|nr:hypothetical protein [Solirubrobacteraceae bacterium]
KVEQSFVERTHHSAGGTAAPAVVPAVTAVGDSAAHAVDAPVKIQPPPTIVAEPKDDAAVGATQLPAETIATGEDTSTGSGGLAAPDDQAAPTAAPAPAATDPRGTLTPGTTVTPPVETRPATGTGAGTAPRSDPAPSTTAPSG